jgi:hypothetical protein
MLSYLAFIHHGIESIGNPLSDGKILAERCIGQLEALENPDQFPPRLLILLASSAYLDPPKSEQLLNGVLYGFDEKNYRNVPLMGCSVAAVFFNRRIYHEGALLVCLASRLLEAKVEASPDTRHNPEKAIQSLLQKLELFTEEGEEIHSFANRTFFTFFPGFGANKYPAPELHDILRTQLEARVSIFGGVASADDPQRLRSGILFANRKIHRHAVVAASVECGTPFGISLTQGLTDTGRILNVAELDAQDPRVILEFREGGVAAEMERLQKFSPMPLFTNLALDRDPIVDTPIVNENTVRLTREIRKHEPFHILIPEPERMRQTFRSGVKRSLDKEWLLNPIGALGFRCTGLLRHHESIQLDLEYENALIEHDLALRGIPNEKPFVGGFVDGEAGVDRNGKSVIGNWSNTTLVFGDELRFRTPIYRSFDRLAVFAGRRVAEDLKTGLNGLTQLIYDIGFPGAMLSFCLSDYEQRIIVGVSASGPRYGKVLDQMLTYPLDGDDTLALAAREQQAQLIIDSRGIAGGSIEAAAEAGIVSQYIVPLAGNGSEIVALLQIDLGDISYDTHLYPTEKTVLESLGKIINSGLKRIFNWEENKILRKLDQAMSIGLSASTIKQGLQLYLEQALAAFRLKQGHIRIAQEDLHCLSLVAGLGEYYEETRKKRPNIDFGDLSLTAQTFRAGEIIVINDAQHNKAHYEMCERWKDEEVLCQKLRAVGAYANVPFASNRGERGTINLVSYAPWFFTQFHESTLKLLGERVGFLLETLRRKEGESFLLGVSPQFSKIYDLNDMDAVLASEIKQFAKTVNARVASLYLWEEDRQRYILRAQYGWPKPEWVNAAYYIKKEFWTGTLALASKLDRRGKLWQHIRDLHGYYSGALPSARRFSTYAFGQELSDEFRMEAIPLQLRIAEDLLGVLTLYRPIKRGRERLHHDRHRVAATGCG